MQKIHSKNYAELEKTINRKLRKVGPNYGIRNLYRTPQERYRFEMSVSVDPGDEAKLHQIVREVLRELPGDRPVQAKWYLRIPDGRERLFRPIVSTDSGDVSSRSGHVSADSGDLSIDSGIPGGHSGDREAVGSEAVSIQVFCPREGDLDGEATDEEDQGDSAPSPREGAEPASGRGGQYLPESLVERVKSRAKKKGVSQSALVAEYLAEAL